VDPNGLKSIRPSTSSRPYNPGPNANIKYYVEPNVNVQRIYALTRQNRQTTLWLEELPDNSNTTVNVVGGGGGECGVIFGCSLPYLEVKVCNCPVNLSANTCEYKNNFTQQTVGPPAEDDPRCFCHIELIPDYSRW